jgi:hypothetical protein
MKWSLTARQPLKQHPPQPFTMSVKSRGLLIAVILLAELHGAEFIFVNGDGPGEGLNDPTPAAPVGGNPGTTLGAQRLAILERAGEIWGSYLVSTVPIRVSVGFEALGSNVLAGAGPVSQQTNFTHAPQPNTWYPIALANALAGTDLEPGSNDISVTASSNGDFYYGLDSASPAGKSNFVDVLLHELGHGLGFISYVNAFDGTLFAGQIDIFSTLISDRRFEKNWPILSPAQRAASALNDPNLVWTGAFTTAGLPQKLAPQSGVNGFRLVATLPNAASQFIPSAPAAFGPFFPNTGISGELAITNTGAGANPTDACGPITNGPQVWGKIAFVRRGVCEFDAKVYRAQLAGATAVIIANNVDSGIIIPAGDSVVDGNPVTITIPSVFISKTDGDALLAASPGVQISFNPIPRQFTGAFGNQLRLYAPATFSSGSSVSHWTTDAFPNLLMEPVINPNLDRQLDLTLTQMKDIGWKVVEIPFPHLTYEAWKTLVFGPADLHTAPADDPDSDGVSNQEEYFFGNDPKRPDADRIPVFQFTAAQADLVFTRSKLPTDLSYILEKSTTLTSFQPATVGVDYQILSIQSLGTDAEEITLRLLDPPAALFLRLRIVNQP